MKKKVYKAKKIGKKWYFILGIIGLCLYQVGFGNSWYVIMGIAFVIYQINCFRERKFNKAVENCKDKLQAIHDLYDLSIYSTTALNVKDYGLKCRLAQLIMEKADTTFVIPLNLNTRIAKGRPCFFVGKMLKVPHKQVKDEKILLWDKAEKVSVYVFKDSLEWMSETKHDNKSFQNILKVQISESGDLISILLRGKDGMWHFKGNSAIVLATILTR